MPNPKVWYVDKCPLIKIPKTYLTSFCFQGADKVKCTFTKYFSKTKNLVSCDENNLVGLQRILWKSKPYEALDATIEKNFILKHEQFVEPQFVLQVYFWLE